MSLDDTRSIAELYRPDSPVGTEFFRLFHTLKHESDSAGPKAYLITSATVGEGKSTVAALLSLTLATIKKKTLLIDADLRRPTIHKLFNLYLENGVTEVCDNELTLEKALKESSLAKLKILTAGRLASNPSSYFEDGHVSRILRLARPQFDYVVIDCAPVMPVIDALAIAQEVTSVLLVIKAGATHRELVKQSVDTLKKAGAPLTGAVLNDVKSVLPYHYGHRYAYEYYNESPKP
jgi:protein-tyrosine kinase